MFPLQLAWWLHQSSLAEAQDKALPAWWAREKEIERDLQAERERAEAVQPAPSSSGQFPKFDLDRKNRKIPRAAAY